MGTESIIDMESRIIEAAKIVFVRKGYEDTKMGDIAAEVGISRTALHYYFHTKEVMFDAIFQQLMGGFLPNIALVVDAPTSCLEKILKIVDQYISMLQRNPLTDAFLGGDPRMFDAFIEERKQFVAELMIRMLTPDAD